MRELTDEIIEFWFGANDDPAFAQPRDIWFEKDAVFDAAIRRRFGVHVAQAQGGAFDDAAESARDYLALVVMLDQFPRNLYRGSAQAFAADGRARKIARAAIAKGFDTAFSTHLRFFFYLPFEHSEALADQDECVSLVQQMDDDSYLSYALAHRDVIKRFGRFPHRNAALGRANTPEEESYLAEPGAGF